MYLCLPVENVFGHAQSEVMRESMLALFRASKKRAPSREDDFELILLSRLGI